MDFVWVQPPPSPVTAKTLSRGPVDGLGPLPQIWGNPCELSRCPGRNLRFLRA